MPLVESHYHPPKFLFNRHLETIYPAILRKIKPGIFIPTEINTPDDDFLQFDWYRENPGDKVVIISHGLEGNSSKPYVRGMANAFVNNGWDAIAWNYRGCGSKINNQIYYYHSGATYDLDSMVKYASKHYKKVFLVGFSLGANLSLKYLGEQANSLVIGACVFSAPLNLYTCSREMEKPHNFIYEKRFLRFLKLKVNLKKELLKSSYPLNRLHKINSLYEFDDLFTAPLHGFKDAMDYYEQNSSIYYLSKIKTPTLLINSYNDPFLTSECFPSDIAKQHEYLHFEPSVKGGHVGFSSFNKQKIYWSEKRALEFANGLSKE